MSRPLRLALALALVALPGASAAPGSGSFAFSAAFWEGAALLELHGGEAMLTGPAASLELGRADFVDIDGASLRDARLVLTGTQASLRLRPQEPFGLDTAKGALTPRDGRAAASVSVSRLHAAGHAELELLDGTLLVENATRRLTLLGGEAPAVTVALRGARLDAPLDGWRAQASADSVRLTLHGSLRLHRASGQWDGSPVTGVFVRRGDLLAATAALPTDAPADAPRAERGLLDLPLAPSADKTASMSPDAAAAAGEPPRLRAEVADAPAPAALPAAGEGLAATTVALAALLLLAFLAALKKGHAVSFLAALGSRLRGAEALHHPDRQRILALLREQPGLRLAELERRLALNRSTVEYHLLLLKRCGHVERALADGHTRYFLRGQAGALGERRVAQECLRRARVAAAILRAVAESPGVSVSEVSQRLALHPSHTMYHLRKLMAVDLVDARKEGRVRRLYPTPATTPAATGANGADGGPAPS